MSEDRTLAQNERKKWKAITLDYDVLLSELGNACGLYAISETTRQLCLSLLEFANWKTRYYSPSGTTIDQDRISAWTAGAMEELMCVLTCCDDILSALANLEVGGGGYTNIQFAETVYNANEYITNNPDVTEDWDYDGIDDEDREAALCLAIELVIGLVCDAAIQTIQIGNVEQQSQSTLFSTAEAGLGSIIGVLVGAAVFPPALLIGSVALLGSAILTQVIGQGLLEDVDPYQNASAKLEIRCLMWANLQGDTPSYTAWQHAADGTSSGDAEVLRLAMVEALSSLEFYAQYMNLMSNMIGFAEGDFCNDCEPTTCEVIPDDTGVVPPPIVQFLGGTRWRVIATEYPANHRYYMQMIIPCGCALQNLSQSVSTYTNNGQLWTCDSTIIGLPKTAAGITTVITTYEEDTIRINPAAVGGNDAPYTWEFDLIDPTP